ncbi:hypothetical protein BaRGS_00015173 [Batillaria attramentaria]|uniref:Uncharacterized protein n=1 Tax=Batillaria attramentaria TaxID=370345 RepID=A0ABD0L2B5_9CAEN
MDTSGSWSLRTSPGVLSDLTSSFHRRPFFMPEYHISLLSSPLTTTHCFGLAQNVRMTHISRAQTPEIPDVLDLSAQQGRCMYWRVSPSRPYVVHLAATGSSVYKEAVTNGTPTNIKVQ